MNLESAPLPPIEPCPFCGVVPFNSPSKLQPERFTRRGKPDVFRVICRGDCNTKGPRRDSTMRAVVAWNRRAKA